MIEKIFIVSFIVWAVYITMQKDNVFEKLGSWLEKKINSEYWSKPVHSCPACMAFWHGLYIYWIVFGNNWRECFIVIISAIGLNAILSKLFPHETLMIKAVPPLEENSKEEAENT